MSPPRPLLVSIVSLILISTPAYGVGERWGAYGLYPQGNRRVTGMGGAFVGLSDDVNGILYNPAGLAFSPRKFGFGGNYNYVSNAEANVDGNGKLDGISYRYLQLAAFLKFQDFSIGAGVNSPYTANATYTYPDGSLTDTLTLGLQILNYDLAIAYRITPKFSIGMTFHVSNASENYAFSNTDPNGTPINVSTSVWSVFPDFGVIYRFDQDAGIGAAFTPTRYYGVDTTLNNLTLHPWFRDIRVPPKLSLGGFRRFGDVLAVFDIDLFGPPGVSAYVGSEVVPQFSQILLDDNFKLVPHGGIEWHPVDTKMSDVFVRAGTYVEQPRISGNTVRLHGTLGLEYRIWAIAPSAAIDAASGFTNFTVGVALSLRPFD